jgi:murein DD-endopeptidase MepM/ murein hydrolase activator NlpD
MAVWKRNSDAIRALALAALAAMMLSACTTSPHTQLAWDAQDRNTYYGPRAVKLPPVEQHRVATPAQPIPEQHYAAAVPKPKPRATPGWYTPAPAQPATHVAAEPAPQVADASAHFAWPLKGRVILNYGATDSGERNDGINIAATQGEPVHASASGTVSYCGNELKGYGNLVLIRHDNGYITAYAHVDSFTVGRDDRVAAGQVIGYAGSTGDVATPQLHFEIRRGVHPVDPKALLPKSVVLASS